MALSIVFVITCDQFQIGCFRSTDCDLCPDRPSPVICSISGKQIQLANSKHGDIRLTLLTSVPHLEEHEVQLHIETGA